MPMAKWIKPNSRLIQPIVEGKAEAVKGNRFTCIDDVLSMPKIRIIGNWGELFEQDIYRILELFDPTNGFIAFTSALKRMRIDKTDNRYFLNLIYYSSSLAQVTFAQISMSSVYGRK